MNNASVVRSVESIGYLDANTDEFGGGDETALCDPLTKRYPGVVP